MKYIVNESDIGKRLDRFLSEQRSDFSRSKIESLIPLGVLVNAKRAKKSSLLKVNDVVEIFENLSVNNKEEPIQPEKGDINIIYENNDFIIILKEKGILVHPDNKVTNGTLLNFLSYYLKDKKVDNLPRSGIIYRLDKATSGLIIVAKTKDFYDKIIKQQEAHKIIKIYKAEVKKINNIPREYEKLIENSEIFSLTGFINRDKKLRSRRVCNLTEDNSTKQQRLVFQKMIFKLPIVYVRLFTGRTHQIRSTLRALGFVIKGDKLYGDVSGGYSAINLECVYISFIYKNNVTVFGKIDELWAERLTDSDKKA